MADWLARPWIEKAICSFYDKDAAQPKFARAQIIQFNKVPCEKSTSAEALLSDKWMYAKAIFIPQAIEEFEKSPSNMCEFSLCDIKGGLIFLNEYRVVPQVNYAKGVWEHLLIVNKFTFKGSEKSSQFGSELINSAAHSPFQVRIKKHFQLKQLVQLLQRENNKKLVLDENKAFDIKAITDSFVERHQFVFIPVEQQKLLDNITEWRSDFCPSSTMDQSNSLNTSLPSNQNVQNDVGMSPISYQSKDHDDHQPSTSGLNTDSNDFHFSLKEPPPSDGQFGLTNLSDDDGTYIKIPDPVSLSLETVQRSSGSSSSISANVTLEQHLGQPKSEVSSRSKGSVFTPGNKTTTNNKNKKDKRMSETDMDIDENYQDLHEGYSLSKGSPLSMVPGQLKENSASELTVQPPLSAYGTLLDVLETLEQQSDPFACTCNARKRDSVECVVTEDEDWNKATSNDKQVRLSSIELALANQMKMRNDWLGRCSKAQASFHDSSLSDKHLDCKEMENCEESGSRPQKEDSSPRGTSTTQESSRFWLEFSQSQYLEERELDDTGNKGVEDLTAGDQLEIVFEDFTDDGRNRTVKKVVSISKEACHSGDKEDDNQATAKSFRNDKKEDEVTGKLSADLESHELNINRSGGFSSGSKVLSKFGKSSYFPGIVDDGRTECNVEETQGVGILGNRNLPPSIDGCAVVAESDVMKGMGAKNTINSQHALTNDESLTSKENSSVQQSDSIVGTDRYGCDATFNSQCVLEVERKRVKALTTSDESLTTSSVLAGAVTGKENQELSKKSCMVTHNCNKGGLSTTVSDDKESSFCSEECLLRNSMSDGSSSLEQKSDESFSILKNTSISDLTPGEFNPVFTSTARPTSTSADKTQSVRADETQDHSGEAEKLIATKKRVTFGKSILYLTRHDIEESLDTTQCIASPYHNDPTDDDSIVPCTQQEDDSQLMTFQDPLQILRTLSSSATEVFQEDPNSKVSSGGPGHDGEVVHYDGTMQRLLGDAVKFVDSVPKGSPNDFSAKMQHPVGNILQTEVDSNVRRSSTNDAMRHRGRNEHAPRLESCDSDVLWRQNLDKEQRLNDGDAPNDNDDNSQAPSITGDDKEIILCSDESDEFVRSPLAVAKDSVLQCIKQSSDKVYNYLVMGSDDSAGNNISSSPKTAAKQNILRCIQQQANDDSRNDVLKALSQSKETSKSPLKGRATQNVSVKGREKSLQFTLTDSELGKALISPAEEENTFLSGSQGVSNLEEGKSPPQMQRVTSTTPVTETGPCPIPCSTFYKTKYNNCKERPQEGLVQAELGPDVNLMSLAEDTGAHDGNTAVAMKTHVLQSRTSNDVAALVLGEGKLKRKRAQEDNETKAAKKLTISAPSTASAQVSTTCLNTIKNNDDNVRVLNVDASSQAFTEYSCDHVLYSQQDPLVLEFSSSENSDHDSSQENKINDLLSSPILLPSPPREVKTVRRSTETGVANLRFINTEKAMEEFYMSEEQELSSPKFVSLPSYQVPTTNNNKCLDLTNKQKNTTQHNNTSQGKINPIILSDSEEDESESSFCWFTTR